MFFKKPHNKAFSKNSDKKTYSNDPKKQFCVILIVIFTFAGFADLPAAKASQFADCRRQRKLPAKPHVYLQCNNSRSFHKDSTDVTTQKMGL